MLQKVVRLDVGWKSDTSGVIESLDGGAEGACFGFGASGEVGAVRMIPEEETLVPEANEAFRTSLQDVAAHFAVQTSRRFKG